VRQFHGAFVDDEQPSANQRLESGLRRSISSRQLVPGMPRPGELGSCETKQDAPRGLALSGNERRDDQVGMPGEGAGDASQRFDSRRADDAPPAVARLPDLREHELQQR